MKTLIIGQAPAYQKQQYPYDTTQLYDWLAEIGISKERAQELFEFDAVYDKFPGYDSNGGHLKPTKLQMDDYWERELELKVQMAEKIILLGNVSRDYFYSKPKTYSCKTQIYELIHPSKRNIGIFNQNRTNILETLKKAIK